MTLTSGTKLGPYEIQSQLGAGGMGEVYRASDTRLSRTVAIKILPESFSRDADRLHRFEHEARILSTLNHPNVLAVYDVGEQVGIRYLVSEFLEGQTLRDKLSAGALSRWRSVEYALEIAKGLAAAHDKGIVHRDLKPDNIFITQDDRVKVLDFGLAKQASGANEDGATVTGTPTTPGTVMGTVGYMSPEQVRGQALDHRSDIFSFGAVLYEMTTGKRAFHGDSSVETMNAILKEDVQEISVTGTQVSPGLERIVRRCLEKKPERRFQSASDLAFALEALSGTTSAPAQALSGQSSTIDSAGHPAAKKGRAVWIIAAACAVLLAGAGFWFLRRPAGFNGKFTQISFRSAYIRTARFAAGKSVIYGARINGEPMELYSTRTDTIETQPLNLKADLLSVSTNAEMALSLNRSFDTVWTPTGRLARAPLGGGATRELLDGVTDADWNKDGSEMAIARRVDGKFRLEYPPGKVLYQTLGYISDIRFSPTGDKIAFLDHPIYGDDRGDVAMVDLQGNRKVLASNFASEQGLAWSPKGDEIWFTATEGSEQNVLRAVDLSGRRRVVVAGPVRMHLQDIAPDGKVLLTAELLRWQVGVGDKQTGRTRDMTSFQWPMVEGISSDGGMVLLNSFDVMTDTNYRLYLQRTDGSVPVLLGAGAGTGFSFDGKWVTAVDPSNLAHALVIPTGVGETRKVEAPKGTQYGAMALLPDNKSFLVSLDRPGGVPYVGVQDLENGTVTPVGPDGRFISSFAGMMTPGPSPDGKSCLMTDGKGGYWLQPLDGGEARRVEGISQQEKLVGWHEDSNNVFVSRSASTDVEIYSVNLTTGERKLWMHFSPPDTTAIAGATWVTLTPDGAHFTYMMERVYSTLYLADGLR